ncbi:DJ-1/PfpI family protein [Candidatus Thorarchaeota archaeon]|nr:MAG: DJ-1/PfpI family protein [Candidatus Thorarchaeota archaeon]
MTQETFTLNLEDVRKIGIYLFPLAEELDFVGVYEVLASVKTLVDEGLLDTPDPIQVEIFSPHRTIECANRMIVKPHIVTDDPSRYDFVIVPGGKGIRGVMDDEQMLRRLREFSEKNPVCSVCTGALILGAAGILEGKKAATHQSVKKELAKYATVTDDRVVLDGRVITAAGVASSIPLGLRLLQVIHGHDVAEFVADELEIPSSLRTE